MTCIRKKIALSLILVLSYQYPSLSQEHIKTKVTIQHGKVSLIKLIDILKKQTGYAFAYDCKLIDPNKMVICDFPPNSEIETILNQSLPSSISYKNRGNHIILFATRPVSKIKTSSSKPESENTPTLPTTTEDTIPKEKHDTLLPPITTVADVSKLPSTDNKHTSDYDKTKESVNTTTTVVKDTVSEQIKQPIQTKNLTNKTIEDTLITPRKNNLILQIELAGYNQLECVSTHIGYKRYYGLISYSSDFKIVNWMGVGIGTEVPLFRRIGFSTELCYNQLTGGDSYKNGLTASILQIKPTLSYELFGFLKLVIGAEGYLLSKKHTDPTTKAITTANPSFGYGIYFGTRIDINQLFIPKPTNRKSS